MQNYLLSRSLSKETHQTCEFDEVITHHPYKIKYLSILLQQLHKIILLKYNLELQLCYLLKQIWEVDNGSREQRILI